MSLRNPQRGPSSTPAQPRRGHHLPTSLYNAGKCVRKAFGLLRSALWGSARTEVAPAPDSAVLGEMRAQAGARAPGLFVSLLRPEAERRALSDARRAEPAPPKAADHAEPPALQLLRGGQEKRRG